MEIADCPDIGSVRMNGSRGRAVQKSMFIQAGAGRIAVFTPFPRTFYPNARDLATAERIVLHEGEQFLNADIHLSGGRPTRELAVRLQWKAGGRNDHVVWVDAQSSQGDRPFAYETAPGAYRITLLREARYTIYAEQDCGLLWKGDTGYPVGTARTQPVRVDGSDVRTTEVTLVFPANGCEQLRIQKLEEIKNTPQPEQ